MTYLKMIKNAEKYVQENNKEIYAVKWLFLNCPYFPGYGKLNEDVPENVYNYFNDLIKRYVVDKIPPQYLLNKAFFFNYEFYVDEGCFIPRNETEQLVEETIYRIDDLFKNKQIEIADVCCGSGIIGITLKKEIENCHVTMCDISSSALEIVKKNALKNKADVEIIQGDFIEPILNKKIKYDVIVCNPPYIKNDEILDEMVVDHEPKIALFGGVDGLDFYRIIFKNYSLLIKEKGFMAFEFGYDQKDALENLIKELLPNHKYEFLKDYNNKYRMLFIYNN